MFRSKNRLNPLKQVNDFQLFKKTDALWEDALNRLNPLKQVNDFQEDIKKAKDDDKHKES